MNELAPSLVRNGAVVGGSLMAFVGLWWESPAWALIVVGGLLAAVGAWSTWNASVIHIQEGRVDDR